MAPPLARFPLLRRIRAAIRQLLPPPADPIRAFFALPYEERVAAVKHLYRHESKKQYLGDWFSWSEARIEHEINSNFRPYFDLVLGYARVMQPASILQLGSYTMTESRCLVCDGFPGRIIASDYSAEHLRYLERGFAGTRFGGIQFRVVDLEQPRPDDFADIAMIVAMAVLSNIQPEGLERFFAEVAASPVQCLLVADMYTKASLGIDPRTARSVPLPNVRNWCHPYLALARKHGLQSFFLPDFTYSSFLEARGIFVIHRGIPVDTHVAAIGAASRRYIERQDLIWTSYAAESYAGLEARSAD
ncbi:MAG TPA: class I SAM-dependent methyltransferase [Stellaceae bacterium]|nr:class I SAM-dependent methyltransferase [Stellaceae bacterium]